VYEERKKSSALYFFCSTAAEKESIEKIIVHTILHQIVCSLPPLEGGSFVTSFNRALFNAIPREKYSLNSELEITSWYTEEDLPDIAVSKALANLAPSYHWDALERIDPRVGGKQGLSIIVDGLDEAERQTTGFIKKVYNLSHTYRRGFRKLKFYLLVLVTHGLISQKYSVRCHIHVSNTIRREKVK